MKYRLLPAVAVLFVSVVAAEAAELQEESIQVVWDLKQGVVAPECVHYHTASKTLFVSQIGGGGGDGRDGDGWISKVTLDGRVVKNKWVTGFNAPKGIGSYQGMLWVSDIDRLVGIDIATGKVTQDLTIAGAKFLNDVACGPDGAVYVSDTLTNRIHRYQDSKLIVLAEGEQLEHPNGLLVQGDKLIIATWGIGVDDQWVTKRPGRLLAMNLKSGELSAITTTSFGNLDGLTADGHAGYLVTDWMAGKVLHVSPDGEVNLVYTCPKGVAAHEYVVDKELLILPQMLENSITALRIGKIVGESK